MLDKDRRFQGVANVLGQPAFERLQKAHVAIAGIGGVGSWTVEALARSGVGYLTLIDLDEVCSSNINRQIHALDSTVGQSKIDVMKNRCLEINPNITIRLVHDFVLRGNVDDLIKKDFHCFVDATDSVDAKCAIAVACRDKAVPLVTIGGAGAKSNPGKIVVDDLNRARDDKLLKRTRYLLKRHHGFTRSKARFGITAIYSPEPKPILNCEVSEVERTSVKLDCAGGLGALSFVTGTFGFYAAHEAIKKVLQ